ncbi:DEAD/DEAH box helicase [Sinomonas susongensis]|uniref:DEAD/DEAH box helicase n=1 Tax=Sinomonas susongensis TaxID=1324851 RepID=UPI001BB11154|nr:DEAD/DEAH box helicase family protein [Sinomonas susongensis]
MEEQFDRAIASYEANPNLIGEHANLEESIRVGGYANRTLLELVQNAADAMAGASSWAGSDVGRVEIVLDPQSRTLYCANSGRPFSKKGLTSIAHAYLSGKRGDEIGRFGLGFKSVLAVTDCPQVLSRSVSFEFNSDRAKEAIRSVGVAGRRLPILRTATLLDPEKLLDEDSILRELAGWATTIVRLPELSSVDRLRREMEAFSSEFLLFVGAVREVHLRVLGDGELDTHHVSRNLGNGLFRIERPDGTGDEWIVGERMHTPSSAARREVGEAVSRDQVKVTVAIPARYARQRVGKFWSYFPLQDETSASGLFNAPWSVNDDRTTLLRNDYNREILATLAEVFVDLLPGVSSPGDPAAHLDYLPARGQEVRSFGDTVLCALVPRLAVNTPLIPNGEGELSAAAELLPLDFAAQAEYQVEESVHHAWIKSPNTERNVPHWRCYSSSQRFLRLRQLFAVSANREILEEDSRDMKRALEAIPKRGILSWLREWADGEDVTSSADALKFVMNHRNKSEMQQARVIPTSDGLKSLHDANFVFLEQADDLEVEGAVFVNPEFLASPDTEKLLREAGFRDLGPVAILHARIAQLTATDLELQSRFWDAVLDVSQREAAEVIRAHPHSAVLVPTRDGGWAWPQQVVDLDESLPDADGGVLLDRHRCMPAVAHLLGVIEAPRPDFSFEDELAADEYRDWVLAEVNSHLTPGDRPVEAVSLYPSKSSSPGPFSILLMLRDAKASEATREAWTRGLLEFGDAPWDCEDSSTGVTYRVKSPVRWAVEQAGLLSTSQGYRQLDQVVAPSLVQYRDFLPLFTGPRSIVDTLDMPDSLDRIPREVLRDAFSVEILPPNISDAFLVDFILAATPLAYPQGQPPKVPARVGRVLEAQSTKNVYVAVTDEQRDYLAQHQRAYLRATEDEAKELVERVGCLRFEDSFAFSILIDGQQESERVLDVFTGLRSVAQAPALTAATIARAASITKRVTTKDGVEDQSREWQRDGAALIVSNSVDLHRTLAIVSEAFDMGFSKSDIERVLQTGLSYQLEQLRQEAIAAQSDADRLSVYFGDDDLRDALPKGLWQGLQAQGPVTASTSVAELFLTVYGKDSLKLLSESFRRLGFSDVPGQWAGGAATISWLRRMGFGAEYAGQRAQHQDPEFIVPGATILSPLHDYQADISRQMREVLVEMGADGRRAKAMVELPTGAGKTRVATQTVLQLFIDGLLRGAVLWIAQSQELCEQAVQTFSEVWRGLGDERPLTVGRLWENNEVHQPDTDFSVIVATDAKLEAILANAEYEWLSAASAVFVDEGHVAGTSTRYTRLLSWLGVDGRNWQRPLVGLSATPFKGKSVQATDALAARFGRRKLSAFEENPYAELVSRGVLARVKHEVLQGVEVSMTPSERAQAEKQRRIDAAVLDRVATNHARTRILVDSILRLDPDWPVLVFTPNVLSAQVLAATLRYRGIEASSVSGQTGRQERRDVIDSFKSGRTKVLANCDLLIQGFDAPGVRALYIARPTFSPNAYIQMAGRGLRGPANGGKEECLIVDMADNFGSSDINNLLGFREYEELWQEQRS